MARLTMSTVNSRAFDQAYLACEMAFGCMARITGSAMEIICFRAGDAEVICDTLQEVGSAVIALVYL